MLRNLHTGQHQYEGKHHIRDPEKATCAETMTLSGDGYRKVAKQKACLARFDHLVDSMISAPKHKGTYMGCWPSRGMHLSNAVMNSSKSQLFTPL
jgi:hypothetical protein